MRPPLAPPSWFVPQALLYNLMQSGALASLPRRRAVAILGPLPPQVRLPTPCRLRRGGWWHGFKRVATEERLARERAVIVGGTRDPGPKCANSGKIWGPRRPWRAASMHNDCILAHKRARKPQTHLDGEDFSVPD